MFQSMLQQKDFPQTSKKTQIQKTPKDTALKHLSIVKIVMISSRFVLLLLIIFGMFLRQTLWTRINKGFGDHCRRLFRAREFAAAARSLHEKSGHYKMFGPAKVHQSPLDASNASKAASGKCQIHELWKEEDCGPYYHWGRDLEGPGKNRRVTSPSYLMPGAGHKHPFPGRGFEEPWSSSRESVCNQ